MTSTLQANAWALTGPQAVGGWVSFGMPKGSVLEWRDQRAKRTSRKGNRRPKTAQKSCGPFGNRHRKVATGVNLDERWNKSYRAMDYASLLRARRLSLLAVSARVRAFAGGVPHRRWQLLAVHRDSPITVSCGTVRRKGGEWGIAVRVPHATGVVPSRRLSTVTDRLSRSGFTVRG